MSTIYYTQDNAIGLQLASAYTAGSGNIALKAGQGAKFVTFPTTVTLITNGTYNTGAGESLTVFTVTGKSTDTLTGVVVASGYTDTNYSANDYCEGRPNTTWAAAIEEAIGGASELIPTAVKTANYTAVPGNFVPASAASGSITITLPTAPANGSQVGVIMMACASSNTVTIACGGSDVFNVAGGSTSGAFTILNQMSIYQYFSGIWYIIAAHKTPNVTFGTNLTLTVSAGVATVTAVGGAPGGTANQIQYDNAGAFGGFTMSGDATIVVATGVITVTETNGVAFGPYATLAGVTQGTIPYMGASSTPTALAVGTVHQPLESGGSAANIDWNANSLLPSAGPVRKLSGQIWAVTGAGTPVVSASALTSLMTGITNTGTLTIPANTLIAGQAIRLWLYGTFGCTASTPTITYALYFGSTQLLSAPALLSATATTNGLWQSYYSPISIVIQTIGASGTCYIVGSQQHVGTSGTNLGNVLFDNTTSGASGTPITINTTASALIDLRAEWSTANAANTLTLSAGYAEVVG
jgi:hypothetical protein